jgi:hypothetical protein
MRVVKEILHPQCKITIFSWNNRYLIKLEQGTLEQTFKIDQFDISGEDELIRLTADAEFLQQAFDRFQEMGRSLDEARGRT